MDIPNWKDTEPKTTLPVEKEEQVPIVESSFTENPNLEDKTSVRTDGSLSMSEDQKDSQVELETNPTSERMISNGSNNEDTNMEMKSEETLDKQGAEQVDSSKETTPEKNNTPIESHPSSNTVTEGNLSKKLTRQVGASALKTKNTSNTENKYVPGSLDEYRHRVLHLERIYLTKIYEAERAKLYHAQVAKINYEYDCQQAEEEFELGRRLLITRLLYENADRRRRIEELKYKIFRDENSSVLRLRRHDVGHRTRSAHQPFNGETFKNPNGKEALNGQEKEGTLFSSLQNCTDQDANLSQLAASSRWNRLVRGTKRSNEEKNQLRVVLDSDEMKEDLAEISATPHKGTSVNSSEDNKYKVVSQEEEKSHTYYHVRGRKRKARGKGRVAYGKNR